MEKTSAPTSAPTAAPTANTEPKSAVVTLHASGSTMTLLATRKADGSVVTTVTTKDAEKKSTRGMTEQHNDMAAARAHLAALAEKATKLGWQRRTAAGAAAKPDAFSKLPAAPKVENKVETTKERT